MGKRKYFEKYLSLHTECGFTQKVFRDFPNYTGMKLKKRGGQGGFVHYEGLQDYIAGHKMVTALQFDKLDYLFRIYFSIITAILFVNLVHCRVKEIAKKKVIHIINIRFRRIKLTKRSKRPKRPKRKLTSCLGSLLYSLRPSDI